MDLKSRMRARALERLSHIPVSTQAVRDKHGYWMVLEPFDHRQFMEHAGYDEHPAPQHAGDYHMPKKFFDVVKVQQGADPTGSGHGKSSTKAEAEGKAVQQMVSDRKAGYQFDYYIVEAVSVTTTPLPKDVEVIDLSSAPKA